jgi:5-methylcytosine-specific restriction endonuclease McrA
MTTRSGKKQFEHIEWLALKKRYKFRCVRCGIREEDTPEKKLTADHVTPLAMGGAKSILNIQPLCLSCNRKKKNTWADYRDRKFKNDKRTRKRETVQN